MALSLSFAKCQKHPGHDVLMGDTISSDVSMADAEGPGEGDDQGQAATLDDTAATAQAGTSQETAGLSSSSASAPRTVFGAEAPPGLLALEDVKPDEYYQASDQIRYAKDCDGRHELQQMQNLVLRKYFCWKRVHLLSDLQTSGQKC